MTNKQLFNGINSADDKFIIEALEDDAYLYSDVEKKHGFGSVLKTALPCAACAALIFGAVIGGRYFGGVDPVSPFDVNTASDISSDSSNVSAAVSDSSSENPEISNNTIQQEPLLNGLLEPVIPDPATFWEGELPVLPVKEFDNSSFKLSLDRESGWAGYWLETERGSAVYAVADGEVYFVGERGLQCGRSVIVKHNENLYTCYDNLDVDCGIPVTVGDTVKAGQVIGYSGLRVSEGDCLKGIVYTVYTYDPLQEMYFNEKKRVNDWKNSGLSKPLDNISENFDFGNVSLLISRDEPVIPAPQGANVYAVDSGVVTKVADYGGLGYIVAVMHEYDDVVAGVISWYYHLGDDITVKEGDIVESGDVIGHVSGSSFSGVSGLGYGIESYWVHSNPIIFQDDSIEMSRQLPSWH